LVSSGRRLGRARLRRTDADRLGRHDGDWNDGAQWSDTTPPGTNEVAFIVSGGNPQLNAETVTLDGNAVQNSGEIDVGVTSAATLLLDDGASITGGRLVLGTLTVSGTLDVETGGAGNGATLDGVSVTNYDGIEIDPAALEASSRLTMARRSSRYADDRDRRHTRHW